MGSVLVTRGNSCKGQKDKERKEMRLEQEF